MNEDYLWDKTGEADAEIELLEQRLGQLKFKRPAEPLPLPAPLRLPSRLSVSPALAIAATLLVLLLAGGLWLSLRDLKPVEQITSGPRPPIGPEIPTNNKPQPVEEVATTAAPAQVAPRHLIARRSRPAAPRLLTAKLPRTNVSIRPRPEEIARGENAKAQLILALHIVSDKLSTVQKKIQSGPGI
jgi:hypothetical protein